MRLIEEELEAQSAADTAIPDERLALMFACGWVTYIVCRTRALPGLDSLTIFIASLYGLGKAGETVQRVLKGKQE